MVIMRMVQCRDNTFKYLQRAHCEQSRYVTCFIQVLYKLC